MSRKYHTQYTAAPYVQVARLMSGVLLILITLHTLYLFFGEPFGELLIYLIPSFVLGFLLVLTFKLEKLSGILFVFLSFGFLLIYQIQLSLTVFIVLFVTGMMILSDVKRVKITARRRRKFFGS